MAVLVQLLSVVFGVLLFTRGKGESVKTWAKLHPDTFSSNNQYAEAANAIDGRTNIGESGAITVLNCASTKHTKKWRQLQYLQIDLQRPYSIAAVRLHLRDGASRQYWQNGLVVSVSNSTIDTTRANVETQCGRTYSFRSGQSPLFSCWTSGRYVYAVLRNSVSPLQVCEMEIFKAMDLSAPGVATIFPNEVYENNNRKALAGNAVDGLSNIGESGGSGGQNCAGLYNGARRPLQYLRVDLGHRQHIYSIRLHLRDGSDRPRYKDQGGMVVSISDSAHLSPSNHNCDPPYRGREQSPKFVCNSFGQHVWMVVKEHAKPLFVCEVEVYADIRCYIPASPRNGNYTATRLTHGGSVSVSCQQGFRPSSLEPVTCEMSGNWSRPLPTCQETTCSILSNISNGDLQSSSVTVGSTATYRCKRGFKFQRHQNDIQKMTLNCVQRNISKIAEWDKSEPTCIEDDRYCVSASPQNGTAYPMNDTESGVRTAVFFKCNAGYALVGPSTLPCENGTFSGKVPRCVAVCPRPSIPENVDVRGIGNKQHLSVNHNITYRCHFGYETSQNTTTIQSICQSTKQWSESPPFCSPVNCGDPSPLKNGIHNLTDERTSFGAHVSYFCNQGYYLAGYSSAQCKGDKKWSNPAPLCKRNLTMAAKLYPDTFSKEKRHSIAANAIDGRTNIGESGRVTVLNCASTKQPGQVRPLQYLQIDLQRPYSIAAVRLHLRDGKQRQRWQNGLIVTVSNSTIEANDGIQCGVAYHVARHGQSPLFRCWISARYVYAILRNKSSPLQVCEMQIFRDMDLTAPGVATIYPSEVYQVKGILKKALAKNAVDGLSSIGDSGANGAQNCAGLARKWLPRELQYLRIDLGHSQQIYSVRLHLRDGGDKHERYMDQKGMIVSTSNHSQLYRSNRNCGLPYNPTANVQSPVFLCQSSSRFVWMVLTNKGKAIFICEVEIYADVRCSIPANPTNGKYSATRVTHGGSLSLSCAKGFHLSSPDPLICEMSGNWSRPLPTCQAVECGSPGSIKNGFINGKVFSYGQKVTYECESGYRLVGSNTLFCQADRQWNMTAPPRCEPVCPRPVIPENVQIMGMGNQQQFSVDSEITYICRFGYRISDNAIIDSSGDMPENSIIIKATCLSDKKWSNSAPSCSPVNCGDPPSLDHGTYNLTDGRTTFRSRVSYFCNEQYYLFGNSSAQCNGNKQWSSDAPVCKPFCKHPGIVTNGRLEGNIESTLDRFDVNTTLRYKCDTGYGLSQNSPSQRTCRPESLSWSGSLPICQPVDCGQPPPPTNGHKMLNLTTFGSVVTFSCNHGYYLAGNKSASCQANKEWRSISAKCIPFCDPPGEVSNGRLEGIGNKQIDVGEKVKYTCNNGYELSNKKDNIRTCQLNRKWSGKAPTCQPVDCGDPKQPSNGYFTLRGETPTFKTVATFTCNHWHYLKGSQFVICRADGQWNATSPECIPFCERPNVTNGLLLGIGNKLQMIDVDTTVEYQCNTGYRLSGGTRTRTCLSNRQWSGSAPSCKIVVCDAPKEPKSGSVDVSLTTYKSRARYSCQKGHKLQGAEEVECLSTGLWNSGPPMCKPYCTKPPNPINGHATIEKGVPRLIPLGKTVTYSCIEGYVWHGASSVHTCIEALKWSGKAPTCEEGNCGEPLSPGNGSCTAERTKYGGRRRCTCDYGFKFRDDSLNEATCRVTDNVAKWTLKLPSCKEIFCSDLRGTSSPNVILQYRGNRLDDMTSYRCTKGYKRVIGDFERKCQWNEQWSGIPLRCTNMKSCRLLAPPKHGSLSYTNLLYGSRVRYSCDSGYVLQYGSEVRMCQSTGQWTETEPICKHACSLEKCSSSMECTDKASASDSKCRCLDRSQCPSDFSPVCGTDGATYNNKCLMKISGCHSKREIELAAPGECHYGGVCSEPRPYPPPGANCRAYLYRYWFNVTSRQCERYVFGGCFEGRNSFYTYEDCRQTCTENVCKLSFMSGLCDKNEKRWFFNSTSNQCESFTYGGCFGNENNFKNNYTCSKTCQTGDCVCSSITRKEAVNSGQEFVVLKVLSGRSSDADGKVSYKVKLMESCNPKTQWYTSLSRGRTDITVKEDENGNNCVCPKLNKGETYKVGVIAKKKQSVWSIKLPSPSYVKESTTCTISH